MRIIIFPLLVLILIQSSIQAQPFGSAISLDGNSNYIETPFHTNINNTSNITLEAWIKPCDVTGHQAIMSRIWCSGNQNSYYFSLKDGFLRFIWFSDDCGVSGSINRYESNSAIIQANTWQHVAVVHTNSSVVLYLNGSPVSATLNLGSHGSLRTNSQPIRIGTYKALNGTNGLFFQGEMDEVRIWNTAESSANILARYNGSLTGNEPGLMAYYQMDPTAPGNNGSMTNSSTNMGTTLDGTIYSGNPNLPYYVHTNGPNFLGPDTVICNITSYLIGSDIGAASYLWNDGSITPTLLATQTGKYWVEWTTSCGSFSDSIYLTFDTTLSFSLGNDTTICSLDSVTLRPNTNLSNYLWSDGSTLDSLRLGSSNVYWLSSANLCGTFTDSVEIAYTNPTSVDLGSDTTICKGHAIMFQLYPSNGNYLWSNGSKLSVLTVSDSGQYWVESTTICGTYSDTVNVSLAPLPQPNLGPDTTFSSTGILLSSNVDPSTVTFLWNTGSTDSTLFVTETNTYWVEVTLNQCTNSDTIEVTKIEVIEPFFAEFPNIFTPNDDGINDILTLENYRGIERLHFEVFNRWGQAVFISDYTQIQWDGTNPTGQKLPTGTYFFIATIEDMEGRSHLVKGPLQLLR